MSGRTDIFNTASDRGSSRGFSTSVTATVFASACVLAHAAHHRLTLLINGLIVSLLLAIVNVAG